jgi:hypothetical protein
MNDIILSVSEDGLILLYQGSPLCDYKKSLADIKKVADFFKLKLPTIAYNGNRAEWVDINTIEDIK